MVGSMAPDGILKASRTNIRNPTASETENRAGSSAANTARPVLVDCRRLSPILNRTNCQINATTLPIRGHRDEEIGRVCVAEAAECLAIWFVPTTHQDQKNLDQSGNDVQPDQSDDGTCDERRQSRNGCLRRRPLNEQDRAEGSDR